MSEIITSDPAIRIPKTEDISNLEHLKPVDNQPSADSEVEKATDIVKFRDTGEGLHYWTTDLFKIMQSAVAVARNQNPKSKWGLLLERNGRSMLNAGKYFERQLQAQTEQMGNSLETSSLKYIARWYRSLGPTNESEELINPLQIAVDLLRRQPSSSARDVLMGNMLQDIAMRVKDPKEQTTVRNFAVNIYSKVVKEDKLQTPESRAAFRHLIDCYIEQLTQQLGQRLIDKATFYEHFKSLQNRSARELQKLLMKEGDSIGNGEMLEWATSIFLRHRFFTEGIAEVKTVRSALLREDQAIYPWPVEGGVNPIWSFDTLITDRNNSTNSTRVQLKSGSFDPHSSRYRTYLPTIVRMGQIDIPDQQLRDLIQHGVIAIQVAQTPHMRQVDKQALTQINSLLETIAA